ncbi:hypothetical protein ANO11243_039870 [Dothideomycetidae sp. 11243]|nr:hypothetical protein ANO11243_039870 [fungal sp. No.11243]
MPHAKDDLDFPDLPSFPEDVPTVPLLRLSLSKLENGDHTETERFWKASCELGFYYLDLTPDESHSANNGDKNTSQRPRIDAKQLLHDVNELFEISKDDIFEVSDPLPAPDVLTQPRPLIKSWMQQCHAIVTLILDLLNDRLGLPPGILASMHRLHARSADQLRWVLAPPQPSDDRKTAMGEHTDFGSVTVLFNRLGGLQVLPPGEQEWRYVRPLRNHAVVNLGDALVKFSAGILNSNLHRVISPPGEQAASTRMSLVYFSRPEDDVMLKALPGSLMIDEAKERRGGEEEPVSSKEWVLRRGLGVRTGDAHFTQKVI